MKRSAELQNEQLIKIARVEKAGTQQRMIPADKRRLDSLAFLLEGSGQCTAVFPDGKVLLVGANGVDKTTTESQELLCHINDTLSYFLGIKAGVSTQAKRERIFKRICLDIVRSEEKGSIRLEKSTVENIAIFFLGDNKEKDENAAQITDAEKVKIAVNKSYKDIKSIADRSNIARVFPIIAYIARHFKKTERAFSNGEGAFSSISEAEVLRIGEDLNVHAEMRIINRLLKEGKISPQKTESMYIGISKQCCSKCELVLKILNKAFGHTNAQTSNEPLIEARGEHGITFTNWQLPPFLCRDSSMDKKSYLNNVKSLITGEDAQREQIQFICDITEKYYDYAKILNCPRPNKKQKQDRDQLIFQLGLKERQGAVDMRLPISDSDITSSSHTNSQGEEIDQDINDSEAAENLANIFDKTSKRAKEKEKNREHKYG